MLFVKAGLPISAPPSPVQPTPHPTQLIHNPAQPSLRTFRLVFHLKHLYPIRVREWLLNNLPGRKPSPTRKRLLRSMRVRLQRVLYYIDIYNPYTHLDCQFQTGRTRALFESLPDDERETFSLDVTRIDWKKYVEEIHMPGMRRHVLRDEFAMEAVLPEAPQEPGIEEARLQVEEELDTLPDLVRAACARYPEAVACEMQTGGAWSTLTYAQLLERVERRAGYWQALGLAPTERVVLAGDSGSDWVINYLSVSFLGGVVVPVDPLTAPDEVARIADFVQATALIATVDLLDSVQALDEWSGHAIDWHSGEPQASDRQGPAPDSPAPVCFVEPELDAWMEASIIFTSGTRVDPRGVVLSHANLIADLLGLSEVQPLFESDRRLSLLPLHHGLEFTGGLLLSLWSGATMTYLDAPLNSRRILQTIRDRKITALLAVPRILKILIDRVSRLDPDGVDGPNAAILKGLRLIVSGGAPLDGQLFDAYARLGLTIHEGYGLTEASPVVTVNPFQDCRRGSVGIALPGVEIRIDAEPDGEEGEILVRGHTLMQRYLDRPDLTAQILRDGWLYTGDIGRLDADGYLTITGRQRELIVTGAGKNVYPAELEDLYADLPHTEELVVVGLPSSRTLGEQVHGVAVLAVGARELVAEDVADAVRQRVYAISRDLPTYQRIAQVHVWRRPLPRLDDGRVDRAALRAELERAGSAAAEVDIGHSLAPWERDIYQRVSDLSGLAVSEVVAHADAPLDTMINSLMAAELAAGLDQGEGDRVSGLFDSGTTTLRQLLDRVGADAVAKPVSATYWSAILQHVTTRRRPGRMGALAGRILGRLQGVRIAGSENLPADQPYLLVAAGNQSRSTASVLTCLRGYVDGVCLMVEQEEDLPCGWPAVLGGWLVDRVVLARYDSLESGLRAAVAQLGSRRPLLLFPEGQRGAAGRGSGAFKSGIGLLALELGVPVVPLHIDVADGVARIRAGVPVTPDCPAARREQLTSYEVYREIAAEVRTRLRDLAAEEQGN